MENAIRKFLIFIESNDTKRNNISNKFQLFYTSAIQRHICIKRNTEFLYLEKL